MGCAIISDEKSFEKNEQIKMKKILEDIQIKFYLAKIEYFHTILDFCALSLHRLSLKKYIAHYIV